MLGWETGAGWLRATQSQGDPATLRCLGLIIRVLACHFQERGSPLVFLPELLSPLCGNYKMANQEHLTDVCFPADPRSVPMGRTLGKIQSTSPGATAMILIINDNHGHLLGAA